MFSFFLSLLVDFFKIIFFGSICLWSLLWVVLRQILQNKKGEKQEEKKKTKNTRQIGGGNYCY